MERDVAQRQSAACTVDSEHVRIVLFVSGIHKRDNLSLVAKRFREQRADGPIDLAAGENFLLAWAAFTLDKSTRDAATGIGELAILHGQREEVDTFFGVRRGYSRCEHSVVAARGKRCAGRLLGDPACFKFDLLATCKLNSYVLLHIVFLFVLFCLSLSFCAQSRR